MLTGNQSLFQFDIFLQFNLLHRSLLRHQRTSEDESFGNHQFQFIQRYAKLTNGSFYIITLAAMFYNENDVNLGVFLNNITIC